MATGTSHTKPVISWIVGGGVIEIDCRPVCGVMTFITLHVGYKMVGGFPSRRGAIVAGGATPCHQTMIHVGWSPG